MKIFSLVHTSEGRVLETTCSDLGKSFFLDYEKGSMGYRLNPKRVLHEPLAKIIDKKAWVLDTTGGLLRDALIMAFLGCKVWSCEAHPLIATLVQDGLARLQQDSPLAAIIANENRFKFFSVDSCLILQEFLDNKNLGRPDIIYLDPMFPPKRKSSIAKREIQWLQHIHAHTLSMYPEYNPSAAETIFNMALKVALKRVVVKRPLYAPPLIITPALSFSKNFQSARFDIYLTTNKFIGSFKARSLF